MSTLGKILIAIALVVLVSASMAFASEVGGSATEGEPGGNGIAAELGAAGIGGHWTEVEIDGEPGGMG